MKASSEQENLSLISGFIAYLKLQKVPTASERQHYSPSEETLPPSENSGSLPRNNNSKSLSNRLDPTYKTA